MVLVISFNNGIKMPTHGHQNSNISQLLIFGGYVKGRDSWFIIWVNTSLNHVDTRTILPRYEGSCMVYIPEWYRKQKCHQLSIPYQYKKMRNPHHRYSSAGIPPRVWILQYL